MSLYTLERGAAVSVFLSLFLHAQRAEMTFHAHLAHDGFVLFVDEVGCLTVCLSMYLDLVENKTVCSLTEFVMHEVELLFSGQFVVFGHFVEFVNEITPTLAEVT